ncbi:MAG: guanylate kinase, partial [Victivallales bacterium]|nr:guanylate kinase [Victivallales bacterium]
MKGIALVLSGPSGAGKSTVIGHLRKHLPELKFSISCTTRAPRPGETHGVHYYFCSKEEFQQKVDAKAMLEYAHVHLDSYGTPAEPVLSAVDNGEVMLLDIDVQGARQVKAALENSPYRENLLTVFLDPPSMEELER